MRRFGLSCFVLLFALSGSLSAAVPTTAAAARAAVRVRFPATVHPGEATAIRLTLPRGVAAVDGHLVFARSDLELIGVAPVGGGTGLRPVVTARGAAFGVYGLRTVGGVVRVDLVVVSTTRRLRARVVVESVATGVGRRLVVGGVTRTTSATRASVRGLAPGRTIGRRDVAIARAQWERVRASGTACRATAAVRRLDVDGDGCADIVDIQALVSADGRPGLGIGRPGHPASGSRKVRVTSDAPGTLTVDSTDDTVDPQPGDGICADADGHCTLRAAIMESEWLKGDITIDFDLPGAAPVTIQLGSRLPLITRLSASLTIDGYSQPGSAVNTAKYGSNAVPGVLLRGNGAAAEEVGLYLTSGGNTIRGLQLSNLYRGIVVDGADAVGNRLMGNWIGFDAGGGNDPHGGMGILINVGATNTRVGSSALADRNVIGNFTKGIDQYGPGTRGSVIQGNQLCIAPSGAAAICYVGVDHDFGPRDGLVGGDGEGERNVIGPTKWEGVELSHGWDPDPLADDDSRWRITGNSIVGNWIGFRMDGSYDAAFRSGFRDSVDDATGVHVWDGSMDNVIARNYVGSVHDGIRVRTAIASGNRIIGNIVGRSPQGQAAPMSGWGISLSQGLVGATVRLNAIQDAASGGIGLLSTNVAQVRISRNTVKRTSGPSIFLAPGGSSGANHLLAAPRITSARSSSGKTVVRGTGRAGATVEVYRSTRSADQPGLPVTYLGTATVASSGTWHVTVTGVAVGYRVTALQIRTNDDTSAMSPGVTVRK